MLNSLFRPCVPNVWELTIAGHQNGPEIKDILVKNRFYTVFSKISDIKNTINMHAFKVKIPPE